MQRSNLLKFLSVSSLVVVLGASLGMTSEARADHDAPVRINHPFRDYTPHCNPHRPGYHYRQAERARGERDGFTAGKAAGFHDGYHGHVHDHLCRLNLSRESGAYQRGFRSAFEAGYDAGFHAGIEKRERERCRIYSPRAFPKSPRFGISLQF